MKRYFLLAAMWLLVPPLFYLAIPDVGTVGYAQTDTKPDLLVTNLTITPQQIAPGDTVTLSYDIVNMSDRILPHAAIERYYLSCDSNLDASDRAFANSPYHGQSIPPVGRLAVTEQVMVPTWVLPRGMPDCYQLLVLADADNGIDEKSETNNVSSDFLCVLTRSDLVIRDLSVTPSRAKRGQALTLRYRIVNEGDTVAWTSGIERYYLSSDTLLDDGDPAFANSVYHGQPLSAGGSLEVVQSALVPQWALPGDQMLLAQADATNLNLETNQSNNVGAVALHIEHPQEWTHGGPAGRIDQLAVDPGNSAVAYCVSGGRLYKSTDAGSTWSPIDHRFLVFNTEYLVTKLLVDCSGDLLVVAGGLFKGTQGGSQWQKLLSGANPWDPGDFSVLNAAIDPNDPQVLFASWYTYTYMGMGPVSEGLAKSTDGGYTWFGVRLDHPRSAELLVHPRNSQVVYATTPYFWVSTDGGLTFDYRGLYLYGNARSLAADPRSADIVYAVTELEDHTGTVQKTTDGGLTWSHRGSGLPNLLAGALVVDPKTPDTVFAGIDGGGIYRSDDAGASWYRFDSGLPTPHIRNLAISHSDPTVLYVGTDRGVFALQLSRSLFCPGVVSDARQFAGLSVLNPGESEAQASVTLRRADGQLFVDQDVTNPQTITLAAGEQKTFLAADLFGTDRLTGSLEIASSDSLLGFASAGTWDRSELAGIELESRSSTSFVFAEVDPGITSLFLFDPYALEARVSLELIDSEGNRKGDPTQVTIPPYGSGSYSLEDLFEGRAILPGDYVRGRSFTPVVAFERMEKPGIFLGDLPGNPPDRGAALLFAPQFVTGELAGGANYRTWVSLVNVDEQQASVRMRWFASNGALLGDDTETIPPHGKRLCEAQELFGPVEGIRSGFLEIQSSGGRLTGSLTFGDPERARFSYVAPLVTTVSETVVVPYLASDDTFVTALSVVNPSTEQATATLKLHLPSGEVLAETTTQIGAGLRLSGLLTEFFAELAGTPMHGGYLTIESDQALAAFALYADGSRLSFTSITENRQPSPEMPQRGSRLRSARHFLRNRKP